MWLRGLCLIRKCRLTSPKSVLYPSIVPNSTSCLVRNNSTSSQIWKDRIELWDTLKSKYMDTHVSPYMGSTITVTLDSASGTQQEVVEAGILPLQVFQGEYSSAVVCEVNGELWDMGRPLLSDAKIRFLDLSQKESQMVLRHSAAHVLGRAIELVYDNVWLSDGPALPLSPTSPGFFYDALLSERPFPEDESSDWWAHAQVIHPQDYAKVRKTALKLIKKKSRFDRIQVSKSDVLEMFRYNQMKLDVLRKIPDGVPITLYRCGDFVDLCRGVHIPHTGYIKEFDVVSHSATVYDPNEDPIDKRKSLQRLYGIAFGEKGQLKQWEFTRSEASKRDHRKLGVQQHLFMFHEASPGSAFFLPHGTRIYNALVNYLRTEYAERGYQEVRTPQLFRKGLWETSGHWENYKEDMYTLEEGETVIDKGGVQEQSLLGLKPMNCPSHCLIYANQLHSYRDLPMRIADFGALHRNESSGALSGLTRVRSFCQDDAHIFCSASQVEEEIRSCLQFVESVYATLDLTFRIKLSTRPDKYVGEVSQWNQAEEALRKVLETSGHEWELNEGDGAFYGPKLDLVVRDALYREHQCATIQLDFQLPQRFHLTYTDVDGSKSTPVMVHRAILGSVERMLAVLLEHFGGKWPFWLSPRQVMVCPVSPEKHGEYAKQVCEALRKHDFYCDVSESTTTLSKKIREAQLAQYNFILVVGDSEMESSSVNVRTRDNKVQGEFALEALIKRLHTLRNQKSKDEQIQMEES